MQLVDFLLNLPGQDVSKRAEREALRTDRVACLGLHKTATSKHIPEHSAQC